jgi:hypothetical protein
MNTQNSYRYSNYNRKYNNNEFYEFINSDAGVYNDIFGSKNQSRLLTL